MEIVPLKESLNIRKIKNEINELDKYSRNDPDLGFKKEVVLETKLHIPEYISSMKKRKPKEPKIKTNRTFRLNKKRSKKKTKVKKMDLNHLVYNEKEQMSKEIRSIFKSKYIVTNNIKSLEKEKKINDTIVAINSLIMITLCFWQMYLLIESNYFQTDLILTLRTCIVMLSIPNCIY